MNQNTFAAVDAYLNDVLIPSDHILASALQRGAESGLPAHDVAPNQGKLLYLLARLMGARRILEIGTLAGYSAIWLARALPDGGSLITLEADPKHAEVAQGNIAAAGLAEKVEVRIGAASETLAQIAAKGLPPFDLVFIDADKPGNPEYLAWALKLSRVGSLIVGDNVVRDGAVVDAESSDPRVHGVRTFLEMIAQEPRLSATALQTVGSKGWDGFVLALVVS